MIFGEIYWLWFHSDDESAIQKAGDVVIDWNLSEAKKNEPSFDSNKHRAEADADCLLSQIKFVIAKK